MHTRPAAFVGFALFFTRDPVSSNTVVIMNVFSQTLPTSIAEVVVCWAVVGTASEALAKRKMEKRDDIDNTVQVNRIQSMNFATVLAIMVGAAVSIILFGIYHFAHSSPFNQPVMVLFLMGHAILRSVFYFVGREIYSTITVHNFLALIGIMGSIDITPLSQLIYPIITIALTSVAVLIASDLFLVRSKLSMLYRRRYSK